MSRRAETIKTDALRISRKAQRTKADEPGAEERRRLRVRVELRDREAEVRRGDGELGVTAVDVVEIGRASCRERV